MKRIMCLLLVIVFLFCLAACSQELNISNHQAFLGDNTSESKNENADTTSSALNLSDKGIVDAMPFRNDHAWVSFFTDNNNSDHSYHYHAYIDNNGKVLFSDLNGLTDSDGNKYYIDRFFKEADYTFFTDDEDSYTIDKFASSAIKEEPAYYFKEGYACVLCRNCEHDENGSYVACVINESGKVITVSPELKKYHGINIKQSKFAYTTYYSDSMTSEEKENRQVADNIYVYYNGSKTYYVGFGNEGYALTPEHGIICGDSKNERIEPKRFGYFGVKKTESGFDYSNTNVYVLNSDGEKIAESSFASQTILESDFLVDEDLAYSKNDEGYNEYVNITTTDSFGFSVKDSYGSEDKTGIKIISSYESNNGVLYYSNKYIDSDDITYTVSINKLDKKGNSSVLREYTWTSDYKDYHPNKVSINFDASTERYVLVKDGDMFHIVDLLSNTDNTILDEYSGKKISVHDCFLTDGTVYCTVIGKDGNDYLLTYDLKGNKLTEPTLMDYDHLHSHSHSLGFYCGVFISETIYDTHGNSCKLEDGVRFSTNIYNHKYQNDEEQIEGEWIGVIKGNSKVDTANNYVNIKGDYLF